MVERDLPPIETVIEQRTMKHFAGNPPPPIPPCITPRDYFISPHGDVIEMFLNRKKSDQNMHAHNARERMFEEQEKEQVFLCFLSWRPYLMISLPCLRWKHSLSSIRSGLS
jgi:hypothetical protein